MTQTIDKILEAVSDSIAKRFFCGIDVHKQQITIAIYGRDESGTEFLKSELFNTDPKSLTAMWKFVKPYSPIGFVMEATGIYHHPIAQFLEQKRRESEHDFEIFIVNPADVAGIPGQQQRNDKLDSIQLAKFYSAGLLKNGRPLNPIYEDLKALFRMSLRLEQDRTALKNRIIKTLDRAGFRPRKVNLDAEWTCDVLLALTQHSTSIGEFLSYALSPNSPLIQYHTYLKRAFSQWALYESIILSSTQRALIRQDLYELNLKTARRTLIKLEIEKTLLKHPIICNLASHVAQIPGITRYTAIWMLAELGGINRFHNVRQFLTFCGCVPRAEISDQVIYSAHLTRHSNKYLRTMFYQSAVIVCNIVKAESPLKLYAHHVFTQKTGRTKLAYCKIMAKIARISYGIMKNQTPYDINNKPFPVSNNSQHFTILEQKELNRAKKHLSRLRMIKGLSDISCNIEELIVKIEDTLKKKD